MSANTEKASAGRNLLIYAAIVTAVAAYTVLVWSQREEIERYGYPTGLGDGELYDLQIHPLDPEKPMIILEGVPYIADEQPFERWDRDVVKVGRDDDDLYFVYQATSKVGDPAGVEEGSGYLLKLATEEYIKITPKSE